MIMWRGQLSVTLRLRLLDYLDSFHYITCSIHQGLKTRWPLMGRQWVKHGYDCSHTCNQQYGTLACNAILSQCAWHWKLQKLTHRIRISEAGDPCNHTATSIPACIHSHHQLCEGTDKHTQASCQTIAISPAVAVMTTSLATITAVQQHCRPFSTWHNRPAVTSSAIPYQHMRSDQLPGID
jgi:hypothetical protein